MKERPTSVTVFAVINLVLCGLGVIGMILWLLGKFGLKMQSPEGNPVLKAMEDNTAYQLFTDISTVLGFFVAILVISASIGMFSLKPWSRSLTIAYGVYSVLMLLVGAVINYFMLMGPLIANTTGPEHVGMIVAAVFQAVFMLVFIGYYLLMIFMLTRPKVIDAFTPEVYEEYGYSDRQAQPGGEQA